MGYRSQLVLDIEAMSNLCIKCKRDLPHDVCPRNMECTSEGMEAIGSSKIVDQIFDKYKAYIYEYVGHNDSSTKRVLRHWYQDEVDYWMRFEVPRDATGKKKPDNGLLPIDHPAIMWLADKDHHVRQFANKLFKLAKMKKPVCEAT